MKNILIIIISALIFSSCSDDSYNGGVGGNTDYPTFYVKSNLDSDQFYSKYDGDTLTFKYPDFFNVAEFLDKKGVTVVGHLTGKLLENEDITSEISIKLNPLDEQEILIYGFEPNVDYSGWYSVNEYFPYQIFFEYKLMGDQYTNQSYTTNIRELEKDKPISNNQVNQE